MTLTLLPTDHIPRYRREFATCPFCGSEPGLAVHRGGFWLVGCESDECVINPQAGSRESQADAWRKWESRS